MPGRSLQRRRGAQGVRVSPSPWLLRDESLAALYPGWQHAVAREPVDAEVFDEAIEGGVRLLQRSLALPETGVVDEETQRLMSLPRCSMPDDIAPPPLGRPSAGPTYSTTNGFKWGQTWGDINIADSISSR